MDSRKYVQGWNVSEKLPTWTSYAPFLKYSVTKEEIGLS